MTNPNFTLQRYEGVCGQYIGSRSCFFIELRPVLPFVCVSLTVCQMRGGQFPGATATTVCTVEPDICTFSAWNLLYVILLAPKKTDVVPTLIKNFVNP